MARLGSQEPTFAAVGGTAPRTARAPSRCSGATASGSTRARNTSWSCSWHATRAGASRRRPSRSRSRARTASRSALDTTRSGWRRSRARRRSTRPTTARRCARCSRPSPSSSRARRTSAPRSSLTRGHLPRGRVGGRLLANGGMVEFATRTNSERAARPTTSSGRRGAGAHGRPARRVEAHHACIGLTPADDLTRHPAERDVPRHGCSAGCTTRPTTAKAGRG